MSEQQQQEPSLLSRAVEQFRSTRFGYISASDQALGEVIAALAAEVTALRQELLQVAADHADATLSTQSRLADFEEKLAQLHERVDMVSAPRQATPIPHPAPERSPQSATVPAQPRPLEYWAENVPDYGEPLSKEEALAHLSRPRVPLDQIHLPPPRRTRPYPAQKSDTLSTWLLQRGIILLIAAFFACLALLALLLLNPR